MEVNYWKTRYFDILKQNKTLREENAYLSEQLRKLVQRRYKDAKQISSLEKELQVLRQESILQHSFSSVSTRKTQIFPSDSDHIFENFFILGVESLKPKFMYKFQKHSSFDNNGLLEFCFPRGKDTRKISVSGSGSALYALLYSNPDRDENSFIFTIKSSDRAGDPILDIANHDKELLYCCCVCTFEALNTEEDPREFSLVPKCYCIVSYYPCFELHFQVLYRILSLRRLHKLTDISETEASFTSDPELGSEEFGLLEEYYENCALAEGDFSLNLQSVPSIEIEVSDVSIIDCEWTCPTLFSLLEFDDFFKVLCAVVHEKSVIFVSDSLDRISSAVLAVIGLIRPFKWHHLACTVLPDSLKDLMDAPVPFIVGTLKAPLYIGKHLILVNLDQGTAKVSEQSEPYGGNLKEHLRIYYSVFHRDASDEEKREAVSMFVKILRGYWTELIDKMPSLVNSKDNEYITIDDIRRRILESTRKTDFPFMEQLVLTQSFTYIIEEFYN